MVGFKTSTREIWEGPPNTNRFTYYASLKSKNDAMTNDPMDVWPMPRVPQSAIQDRCLIFEIRG
jgi:hypothetical protein